MVKTWYHKKSLWSKNDNSLNFFSLDNKAILAFKHDQTDQDKYTS